MRAAIEQNRSALINGQTTIGRVAEQHGLSAHVQSMYGEARSLGISLRVGGRVKLDHELVITLLEQGLRVAEIQRQLNHPNRQAIDKIAKRYLDENPKK